MENFLLQITISFCILAIANGIPTKTKTAQEEFKYKLLSVHDGKYATVTDQIYSPGPYTTYAVNTTESTDIGQQQWTIYGKWTGEPDYDWDELFPVEGTRMNVITTYKPCDSCFAANNYWYLKVQSGNQDKYMLVEGWTDLCLQNPGNGAFLEKVNCTTEAVKEKILWEIVKLE